MRVKLVRDKIEFDLGHMAAGAEIRAANSKAGRVALLYLKLHEEAQELAQDPSSPEEYADVIQVLIDLARENGVAWEDVGLAVKDKYRRLGGFRRGRVLID